MVVALGSGRYHFGRFDAFVTGSGFDAFVTCIGSVAFVTGSRPGAFRVGRAAGMVLATGCCAEVVTSAGCDALGAPFRADEIWNRLGVLGHVRAEAIAAYAAERQGSRIAFVLDRLGSVGGCLQADSVIARALA